MSKLPWVKKTKQNFGNYDLAATISHWNNMGWIGLESLQYLHSYTFKMASEELVEQKIWEKNKIQDSFVPITKIVRHQNKLNSFGKLIR